ncbi:MAG: hypothetical protein AVDCRST_MAG49-3418, partial [uncultured Thermomicrobiales bacterium]
WLMQRSTTTSQASRPGCGVVRSSASRRSSNRSTRTPRDSKAASSSFSSTRTRERSMPTVGGGPWPSGLVGIRSATARRSSLRVLGTIRDGSPSGRVSERSTTTGACGGTGGGARVSGGGAGVRRGRG